MKLVFGLEPRQTSNNGTHYPTQLSASQPWTFQSTSEPLTSRTVRRYVCTTVCMYDGPRARITFADKSHPRFQFERSIKPRYGVRGASFYFDLNDLRHAFPALNMPPPAKRVHSSRLGSFRSAYRSHAAPQ